MGRTLLAMAFATAALNVAGGTALAADGTTTGPCAMMAMMASTNTPNGGAMNMMNMSPNAMALMMALMARGGCTCP